MEKTITLYKAQILNDINAKVHYIARSHANDVEKEALFQELSEDENKDMVLRSLSSAYGVLMNVVNQYDPTSALEDNDTVTSATGNIQLTLTMPSTFNETATASIAQFAHQLMVNAAIVDWMQQMGLQDMSTYSTSMQNNIEGLRISMTRRKRSKSTTTNNAIYSVDDADTDE